MSASKRFIEPRDRLLRLREDLAAARGEFTWPVFDEFNWASDYFDVIAHDNEKPALRVVGDAGDAETLSFAQLARRSSQVANWLSNMGVRHGDRMLVMLANDPALWETMFAWDAKLRKAVNPHEFWEEDFSEFSDPRKSR